MDQPSRLTELVRNEIPAPFFNSIVDAIFRVYRETYDETFGRFDSPEAIDLLPYMRRAAIEGEVRRIAKKYVELDAHYEKNSSQNSWHTVINSRRGIKLTISATKGPREMVRDARFRETLAKSNQLNLYYASKDSMEGSAFYAIILHGVDELDATRPAFIRIGFPSRDCSAWVENFDLLKFCGQEYSRYVTQEEKIEEEVAPVLRPQIKRKQN